MVEGQTKIRPREWYVKILWDFETGRDHLSLAGKQDLMMIKKIKTKLPYSGLCRPSELLSKSQRKRKKRQLFRPYQKTKKLWNMRVTVIPIVIGAFRKVPKDLERVLKKLEIRGRIETIQGIAFLKSFRIPRIVTESGGDLLSLRLMLLWKTCKKYYDNNIV